MNSSSLPPLDINHTAMAAINDDGDNNGSDTRKDAVLNDNNLPTKSNENPSEVIVKQHKRSTNNTNTGQRHKRPKRALCTHPNCTNQIVNNSLCVKHGATIKRCSYASPHCSNYAQVGGVCTKHGVMEVIMMTLVY